MPARANLERKSNPKKNIVFPAATVGRKGCYELREALRGLDVKVTLLGPLIEGGNFWDGFETERGGDDWPDRADAVVLPAFVEHKPRRLLMAAAAGIPVIASPACGIAPSEFVTVVESSDVSLLREKITSALEIN